MSDHSTDTTLLVQVLNKVSSHGVQFCLDGCWFGDAQDVIAYMEDPWAWRAAAQGVSVTELHRYNDRYGYPQCGAATRKGTRCQNVVVGGQRYEPSDFAEADGGYCHVHGGEA